MKSYGVEREPDIDEAIIDAVYTVYERIDEFDSSRGTLFGWLYTIALNNLRGVLRMESIRPLFRSLEEFGLIDLTSVNHTPETNSQKVRRK